MHMNVEIGIETPIFLIWEYLFQIFGILSLQCVMVTQPYGVPFAFQNRHGNFAVHLKISSKWVKVTLPNRGGEGCLIGWGAGAV